MKTTTNLLNIALIAVLLLVGLGMVQPQTRAAAQTTVVSENECDKSRLVQVSGAAVVYVVPDRALIQLGVQSNGITPEGTQNANFTKVQRVIAEIKDLGVDAKDIATDHYIVYPVYSDYSNLMIKGYRVDNVVSVTLRNINLAEDVILAALRVGGNEVQDVQFYTSELRKHRDQARNLAMTAAKEKAAALAEAAGAKTGCVLTISENTWSSYYGSWRGGRETALWAQNTVQNASSGQPANTNDDSPISLGQIAVRAEVSASYALR